MTYPDFHEGRNHKYIWSLFNMGDGIYRECERCGYVPKRGNKEYWDYKKSGRISCMVFMDGKVLTA